VSNISVPSISREYVKEFVTRELITIKTQHPLASALRVEPLEVPVQRPRERRHERRVGNIVKRREIPVGGAVVNRNDDLVGDRAQWGKESSETLG
jgi:hypothetical protein